MEAKLKCSNCGAEVSNLRFGWSKKEWLWGLLALVPMLLVFPLFFWITRSTYKDSTDYSDDIKVSLIETRPTEKGVEVLGKLTNEGEHAWSSFNVEAEFYDEAGKFIDEASQYFYVLLRPGAEEHFRITRENPDEQVTKGTPKVVLKVTSAAETTY